MTKAPKKRASKKATGKKSSRKKTSRSRAKKSPAGENLSVKKFVWHGVQWYSLARNWRAEYRLRLQTQNFDPFVNPATGWYYTVAAQNYRDAYLQFESLPVENDYATDETRAAE
jgi:hypothetical protein